MDEKQALSAALYLLDEYANLPEDARNDNVVWGVDEGAVLTANLIKQIEQIAGVEENISTKVKLLRKERDELRSMLRECREYFDQRADADMPPEHSRPIPNEKMTLLTEIDETLNKGDE